MSTLVDYSLQLIQRGLVSFQSDQDGICGNIPKLCVFIFLFECIFTLQLPRLMGEYYCQTSFYTVSKSQFALMENEHLVTLSADLSPPPCCLSSSTPICLSAFHPFTHSCE